MSYVRVGIIGSTTGGEVWSINPTFDPSFEFPGTVDQAALDAAAKAIGDLNPGTALTDRMSALFQIVGSRLEVRDDATDDLIGISVYTRSSPLSGTNSTTMPPQCATVFSLRTNTPGASGRGRIYWPSSGGTLTSAGRITGATQTALLAAMKTYLGAMATALATAFPTISFDLAVRSRQTKSTPHVNRLQVGDVVDTQRRRRDNLPETYITTTIP